MENILLNHRGEIPSLWFSPNGRYVRACPRAPFRSTFPLRYWLIDFNHSVYYPPEWDLNEPLNVTTVNFDFSTHLNIRPWAFQSSCG